MIRDLRTFGLAEPSNLCSIFGIDDMLIAGIGGQVAGTLLGNSASKKASKIAQETADKNNATAAANKNQLTADFAPFLTRGNTAGENINALLGLPTAASGGGGAYNPAAGTGTPNYAAYVQNNPDLAALFASGTGQARGKSIEQFGQEHWDRYGQGENRSYTPTTVSDQQAQPPSAVTPTTAQSAFDQYENSTGHQFRLQTGSNAIASNKATSGLLKSGSALKALTQYGQDLGTQDFQGYLGNLQTQQGAGLSGANALAGVGTNYVNQVTGNNDSAGTVAANSALTQGANWNQLLNQVGGTLGSLGGSSFGGGSAGAKQVKANVAAADKYGTYT